MRRGVEAIFKTYVTAEKLNRIRSCGRLRNVPVHLLVRVAKLIYAQFDTNRALFGTDIHYRYFTIILSALAGIVELALLVR